MVDTIKNHRRQMDKDKDISEIDKAIEKNHLSKENIQMDSVKVKIERYYRCCYNENITCYQQFQNNRFLNLGLKKLILSK